MKKILVGLFFLSSFPAWAATTQNKVSMVTFFPVPYVAYSNVSVAKEMDIGLTDQTCSLTLGSTGLNTAPLDVANTNVTNGALFLGGNGAVSTTGPVLLGSPNSAWDGVARLNFDNNLAVGTVTGATSLNTPELHVSTLNLFGRTFPTCDVNGNHTISWAELALGPNKDKKEVYLVCGPVPTDCPASTKPANDSAQCDGSDARGKPTAPGNWTGVISGTIKPCGMKTREPACTNPPEWGWGAWNTLNCKNYFTSVTQGVACSQFCHRPIGGGVVVSGTVTCNGNEASVTNISYDVSGCYVGNVPSSMYCYDGTFTRRFTLSETETGCVEGDLEDNNDGNWYAWVGGGTNMSLTARCRCSSVDCKDAACARNWNASSGDYCNQDTLGQYRLKATGSGTPQQTNSGVYYSYSSSSVIKYTCQQVSKDRALYNGSCIFKRS